MKTKLILLIALISGCATITNAQWQQVNTGLTTNNVNSVVTCGTNVLAGTDAGLFISVDNGDNWTAVADANFTGTEVKALATNGGNVFAATYGKGIFISTDNGVTWAAKNTGFAFLYACSVATVGSTIYASMSFDGVYSSTDNGNTWTKSANTVLNSITVNSIVNMGTNMIAASGGCNGGSTGGVFLSTDNGVTWTATSVTGDADALAINGTTVFAATENGVFKSTDNGNTWSMTTNSAGIIDHAISLAVIGSELLVGCPYSVYSTTDNGTTWNDISTGAGAANLSVTSLTMNSTYIFAGNIYHPVGVWRRALSELTTGIEALNYNNRITVYPNPSDGKFVINTEINKGEIFVYNMVGEKIYSSLITGQSTQVDLSSQPAGIYFVTVKSGENIYNQKIVVQ